MPTPTPCLGCIEERTCSGGYLPHRYSLERQFDNRSVWCADLLAIFGRLRELLDVSARETELRRRLLREIGLERAEGKPVAEIA